MFGTHLWEHRCKGIGSKGLWIWGFGYPVVEGGGCGYGASVPGYGKSAETHWVAVYGDAGR